MKSLYFIKQVIGFLEAPDGVRADPNYRSREKEDNDWKRDAANKFKEVLKDLEVLAIFRKHIELEKEDSDPYDECAFYEDVLYMNINLEQDISSNEYEKIKQWLEEQE